MFEVMTTDYNIKPSMGSCILCGKEFPIGTEYFSALFEAEDGSLERRDYCKQCWKPEGRMYCYWRAKALDLETSAPRLADSEVLFDILEKLSRAADTAKQSLRYIVALALLRRRLLKLERATYQDGREVLIFLAPKRSLTYRVENPGLSPDRIDELTEEMGDLLRGKLS